MSENVPNILSQVLAELTALRTTLQQQQATIEKQQMLIEQQQNQINQLEIPRVTGNMSPSHVHFQSTTRRKLLKSIAVATVGLAATTSLIKTTNIANAVSGSASNIGFYATPAGSATGLPTLSNIGLAGSDTGDFGSISNMTSGLFGFSSYYGVYGNGATTGVFGIGGSNTGVSGKGPTGVLVLVLSLMEF